MATTQNDDKKDYCQAEEALSRRRAPPKRFALDTPMAEIHREGSPLLEAVVGASDPASPGPSPGCREPEPAPSDALNAEPLDPWQRAWAEMAQEASAPQKGFEPEKGDPTSPSASPEIEEWDRHWPADGGQVAESDGERAPEPQLLPSGKPGMLVLGRRVKWLRCRG